MTHLQCTRQQPGDPSRRRRRFVAAAAALTLAVAACGDDDNAGGGATTGAPTASTAASATSAPSSATSAASTTAPASTSGSSGGSAATTGSTPGTGGGGASADPNSVCGTGEKTASDQGVTADTIKIGFASVLGAILPEYTVRIKNMAKAWVKEINSQGGICGRMVEGVFENATYNDPTSQVALCTKLALDEKVFAAVAYTSFDTEAGQTCLTTQHKVPLIAWDQLTTKSYEEAAGYLWLQRFDESLMLRNWVKTMVDKGYVKPSNKIGVLYQGTPQDTEAVQQTLLPELEANGIKPVSVFKSAPDTDGASKEMSAAVLQFQQDGVDYVFPVASIFIKQAFVHAAADQKYFPRYTDSDIKDGCGQLLTTFQLGYPPAAYDKTICVTAHETGTSPANQKSQFGEDITSDFYKYAEEVYTKWSGGGYDSPPQSKDELTYGFDTYTVGFVNATVGGGVMLWADAARRAGPNLTREAWTKAMATITDFKQTAFAPHFSFGPKKWSGPDMLRVVQYHAEASNGFDAGHYQELVPYFDAYYKQ
jgi:ABC-type branched-subunit amino acid transport system substrate-binding protein